MGGRRETWQRVGRWEDLDEEWGSRVIGPPKVNHATGHDEKDIVGKRLMMAIGRKKDRVERASGCQDMAPCVSRHSGNDAFESEPCSINDGGSALTASFRERRLCTRTIPYW